MMMAVWKIAPGARRRQHDRAQAVATRRPRRPCCWPSSPRSSCPPAPSTSSPATATPAARWSSTRPRPWSPSPARCGPACRWPRAPRRDLKRVHLELGGKAPVIVFDDADIEAAVEGIADRRLLQRRPGLHRRHPRAGRPRASTTTSSPPWPSTPGARPRSACPTTTTRCFGPVNNAPAGAASRGSCDRLPDHAAVAAGGHRRRAWATASSSSRPWSPGCARTTRRSRTRSSARSSRCSGSPTRTRRSRWANGVDYGLASQRVDQGLRPGDADVQGARLRLRLDQHPHPARRRDAARRLQAQSGYGKDLSMYGFEDYTRIKHVMANIDS